MLGGKCATEVKYGTLDAGCSSNIERAVDVVKKLLLNMLEMDLIIARLDMILICQK